MYEPGQAAPEQTIAISGFDARDVRYHRFFPGSRSELLGLNSRCWPVMFENLAAQRRTGRQRFVVHGHFPGELPQLTVNVFPRLVHIEAVRTLDERPRACGAEAAKT